MTIMACPGMIALSRNCFEKSTTIRGSLIDLTISRLPTNPLARHGGEIVINLFSRRQALIAIVTITVVGFFLWLSALYILWRILDNNGVSVSYFDMAASLSTTLAAAAVFGAGYIAYRELDEISSSRHLDVADKLFNELNSVENIKARRWIYQNLSGNPQTDLKAMDAEGQEAIKQVLNSLDRVAFLTQSGWIPEDVIMPWMHPMIYKSWQKLWPYVDYERKRRSEPYYYLHAGELSRRCELWRKKHKIDSETKWVEHAL
jgi:hypothetical protein